VTVRVDRLARARHGQVADEEHEGTGIGAYPRPDVFLGKINRLIRFLGVLLRAVEAGDLVAFGFDLGLPAVEV